MVTVVHLEKYRYSSTMVADAQIVVAKAGVTWLLSIGMVVEASQF